MTKSNLVLIFLVVASLALLFFAPQIGWRMRGFLVNSSVMETNELAIENDVLKSQLAKLENIKSQLPEKPNHYIRGIVLSNYPMNFKNEFLVDVGSGDGVEIGRAVIFGGSASFDFAQDKPLIADGVLIGRIEKIFEGVAIVKTVFDNGFQVPVRVGTGAINALFHGGLSPKIMLIPLNKEVKIGDIAYSSSSDIPYGLPIGRIKEIDLSDDKLFREAFLEFSYDLNEINSVFIATDAKEISVSRLCFGDSHSFPNTFR